MTKDDITIQSCEVLREEPGLGHWVLVTHEDGRTRERVLTASDLRIVQGLVEIRKKLTTDDLAILQELVDNMYDEGHEEGYCRGYRCCEFDAGESS